MIAPVWSVERSLTATTLVLRIIELQQRSERGFNLSFFIARRNHNGERWQRRILRRIPLGLGEIGDFREMQGKLQAREQARSPKAAGLKSSKAMSSQMTIMLLEYEDAGQTLRHKEG